MITAVALRINLQYAEVRLNTEAGFRKYESLGCPCETVESSIM